MLAENKNPTAYGADGEYRTQQTKFQHRLSAVALAKEDQKKYFFGPIRVNYTLSNGAGIIFLLFLLDNR